MGILSPSSAKLIGCPEDFLLNPTLFANSNPVHASSCFLRVGDGNTEWRLPYNHTTLLANRSEIEAHVALWYRVVYYGTEPEWL
jgi:hypothetical protein